MAKKTYSTPSVEIEILLTDVLMISNMDNVGEDEDNWEIQEVGYENFKQKKYSSFSIEFYIRTFYGGVCQYGKTRKSNR